MVRTVATDDGGVRPHDSFCRPGSSGRSGPRLANVDLMHGSAGGS